MILFFILFGNRFKKLGVILYQNEVQNCSGRTGGSNLELPWRGKTGQGTSKGMYYLYKNFFHDQRIFNYFNFKIFHSYVSLNMLKKTQSNCLLKFCQGMPSILSSTLTLGQSGLKLVELSFGNILIKKNQELYFSSDKQFPFSQNFYHYSLS